MPFSSPSSPTATLGDDLIRVVKLLHHVRQQAPRRHPQVDPMAYPLLFNLLAAPLRVSALAELVHSDVSTVSRQVSTLVDLGFVTRGPDPDDGRAQALTLTDEGRDAAARHPRRPRPLAAGPARRLGRRRRRRVLGPPAPLRLRPRGVPDHPDHEDHPMSTPTPAAGAAGAPEGSLTGGPSPQMPDHPDGPLTHRQIVTILIGLMMGMFLAALDQTIVATAIRTIADDLQGLNHQAWATTAYLITATIVTPLYGKLGDIYGRKNLFIIAISIFVVGSVLCTFATSMADPRAVPRGAGPRRRWPVLARAGDHRRHRAAARAREVPGVLPRRVRHRLGARPGHRRLPRRPGDHPRHRRLALDLPRQRADRHRRPGRGEQDPPPAPPAPRPPHRLGRCRTALGRARAAAPRRRAGPRVGLVLDVAIACYVIGVVAAIGFFWQESRMGEEAILPLAMFRNRTVGVASAASVLIGVAMFGGLAALPLYLQIVKGATPTEAGLLLLPMTLGIMIGSIVSGQVISRTGPLPDVPDRRVGAAHDLAVRLPLRRVRHPAVADDDRHDSRSAWAWASTSSPSPWPCRMPCRRRRSASPRPRPPSPARSAARSAPPCSCRSCSRPRRRRSRRPCRLPCRRPTSRRR